MEKLFFKLFKFGLVGVSGVLIDFGVTWLLKERLKLNKYISNSTGFTCAVLSNYLLNRIWTFESHDPNVALEFGKFVGVALVGLLINNTVIYLLTEKRDTKFYSAKLIATAVATLWNFGMNYTFTFHQ